MLIGTFLRQPAEVLPIDVDHGPFLAGRAASSITTVATLPAGITMADSVLAGNIFQFYPSGGVDQQAYKLTLTVTFIIGGRTSVVQLEINLVVTEV